MWGGRRGGVYRGGNCQAHALGFYSDDKDSTESLMLGPKVITCMRAVGKSARHECLHVSYGMAGYFPASPGVWKCFWIKCQKELQSWKPGDRSRGVCGSKRGRRGWLKQRGGSGSEKRTELCMTKVTDGSRGPCKVRRPHEVASWAARQQESPGSWGNKVGWEEGEPAWGAKVWGGLYVIAPGSG